MIIASTRPITTSRLPSPLGSEMRSSSQLRQQRRHPLRAGTEHEIELAHVLQAAANADRGDQHIQSRRLPQRAVGEPLDGKADQAAEQHRSSKNQPADPQRRRHGGVVRIESEQRQHLAGQA